MSTISLPDVGADAVKKYWHGDADEYEPEFVEGKLGEVVDKIASRWGAIVSRRLASGALTKRLYEATVVRVASRLLANPEGFRMEQEGGYQYQTSAAVASGTLWFTDDDVQDLTGTNPSKPSAGLIGTATVSRHRPRGNW